MTRCCGMGSSVHMKATVDRPFYFPGEVVQISIELHNRVQQPIEKMGLYSCYKCKLLFGVLNFLFLKNAVTRLERRLILKDRTGPTGKADKFNQIEVSEAFFNTA